MIDVRLGFVAALLAAPLLANAFSFEPGSYYASTGDAILQYAADGTALGRVVPTGPSSIGTETRGIAFGGDGLMYVVRENQLSGGSRDAGVDVMDASGKVQRSYAFSGWIGGMVTSGNIAFANDGQSFYVGAQDGVYQFDVNGSKYGRLISGVSANDLAVMPNGDLLVVSDYDLKRLSSSGALLSSLGRDVADPQGLTQNFNDSPEVSLTDVRGVAYDAATDTTFVSMLGYSGGAKTSMDFKVMALDGVTPTLKGINTYWYAADLFVTDQHQLLVGSWTQAPSVFSTQLERGAQLGHEDAIFVTALPVPEADTLSMFCLGLLGIFGAVASGRRKSA